MAKEIERKFLVTGDFRPFIKSETRIKQGYLSSVPERIVRIRIRDRKGYITIKGIANVTGVSRFEWEKEIPLQEANELMQLCEPGMIDKTRYIVPEQSGLNFEIDEFYGDNEGLLIAEIELPAENHTFEKPDWLGKDVTNEPVYYNSSLKNNPYKNW
jgi:adenylate cyclase